MGLMRPLDPAVASVYITEELENRASTTADYFQEKQALQELAARMVDQPDEVLPRFVDLAMEMTGGVSSGLSLLEENPSPGVFRWKYLRGSLASLKVRRRRGTSVLAVSRSIKTDPFSRPIPNVPMTG